MLPSSTETMLRQHCHNTKTNSETANWFNITKFQESPVIWKLPENETLVQVEGDLVQNIYLKMTFQLMVSTLSKILPSYYLAKPTEENIEGDQFQHPTESEEIVKNL